MFQSQRESPGDLMKYDIAYDLKWLLKVTDVKTAVYT